MSPPGWGQSVKHNRDRAIGLIPATAVVGVLVFGVVSSPLLASRETVTPPAENCSVPEYELDGRTWEQLPAAVLEQSSDNCVGFCFNAVVESADDESSRIARIIMVGEDGALTRGVVERSRVLNNSRSAADEGTPVRFACFDRTEDSEGTTRFDDCVQMLAYTDEATACATGSQAVSDASRMRESELDMFRFGL